MLCWKCGAPLVLDRDCPRERDFGSLWENYKCSKCWGVATYEVKNGRLCL
jgi:hypothetical protein